MPTPTPPLPLPAHALHVRDHGGDGDGPPLVLLHGFGRSLADWETVAPLLVPHHRRVLAVDLPGHGRSEGGSGSPGPWSFETTAAAIERALQPYGIPYAVPVGHSLGGMIALQYAVQNTDRQGGACPGAVNLDGFWWGRPEQYPDLDRTTVTQGLARIGEMTRSTAGLIAPAEYVEQQALYAGQFGIPYARAEAATRGAVRELPDGRFQTLPLREQALETFDALDALDVLALIRRVPCPVLCVRGRRPQPPMPGMEWFEELIASHARGLDRDLAELVRDRPDSVTVEDIDATHAMLLEEPESVAERLLAFTRTL